MIVANNEISWVISIFRITTYTPRHPSMNITIANGFETHSLASHDLLQLSWGSPICNCYARDSRTAPCGYGLRSTPAALLLPSHPKPKPQRNIQLQEMSRNSAESPHREAKGAERSSVTRMRFQGLVCRGNLNQPHTAI